MRSSWYEHGIARQAILIIFWDDESRWKTLAYRLLIAICRAADSSVFGATAGISAAAIGMRLGEAGSISRGERAAAAAGGGRGGVPRLSPGEWWRRGGRLGIRAGFADGWPTRCRTHEALLGEARIAAEGQGFQYAGHGAGAGQGLGSFTRAVARPWRARSGRWLAG